MVNHTHLLIVLILHHCSIGPHLLHFLLLISLLYNLNLTLTVIFIICSDICVKIFGHQLPHEVFLLARVLLLFLVFVML